MNIWVLIGVGIGLFVVLSVYLYSRMRETLHDAAPAAAALAVTRNAPTSRKRHYYGVSIKAGVNTCDAVDAIRNDRFLLEDAPKFPLPGCDRGDCSCVALPEDDRRAANDRRRYSFTAYGDYNPNAYYEKREDTEEDRRETDPVR